MVFCRSLPVFWRTLQAFAGFEADPCMESCRFGLVIVGITIALIYRQDITKGWEQNRQLPAWNIQKPTKRVRKPLKSLQETDTVLWFSSIYSVGTGQIYLTSGGFIWRPAALMQEVPLHLFNNLLRQQRLCGQWDQR